MLVLRPLGTQQARYYLDRGDPGLWLGSGCDALGLHGSVERAALAAVLCGRSPDGSVLLRRIPANRRAGFDLIFGTPKSFSLLAALAPLERAAHLREAHAAAVRDVVAHLEHRAARTRRGRDGRLVPTEGFIAASFGHFTNRAGEPHLHTHVVVANLVRGVDGRWSCLDRRSLTRYARSAGAVYHASLRREVALAGFPIGWRVRPDGLGDVAGVPPSAIAACSSRRREVLARSTVTGTASARARMAGAGITRRNGTEHDWEARAAEAGLDRSAAARLLASAGPAPNRFDVEDLLAGRGPAFNHAEVMAALAAAALRGASATELDREAWRFLDTAVPVDATRWTTARARRREAAVVESANRGGPSGIASAPAVEATLAAHPGLSAERVAAVRQLTTGGRPVEILGAASLVDQAGAVGLARSAWAASGHHVAVLAPSEQAQARWHALTGLRPPPPSPAHASVLIVDGADYLATSALHRLVSDATQRGAKLVLVPGGTAPLRREPASPAMTSLANQLGPVPLGCDRGDRDGVAIRTGRDGAIRVAPTVEDATRRLVADWHTDRARIPELTMIALGPDEAEHLNRLARARLAAAAELTGPPLPAGHREVRAGDRIRVLRRDGSLGVGAGTVGLVVGVDPSRREAVIRWPDRDAVVPATVLAGRSVTYAYATTPAYLRRGREVPVLALGAGAGQARAAYVVAGEAVRRPRGLDPTEDLVAALDVAAVGRSDTAGRTLAELTGQRDRLGAQLRAAAPADVSAELRRVEEDRVWLTATAPWDCARRVADLDRQQDALRRAEAERATWLARNRPDIERWAALDAAIEWRSEALAVGAVLAPTRAVAERLGPAPSDESSLRHWRRAAACIETYRDRWELPDRPLGRSLAPDETWSRSRQADHVRMLSACRASDRAQTPQRAPGRSFDNDLAVAGPTR